MTLCWHTPDSDGGTPITGYIVEYKKVASTSWSRVNLDVALGITLEITGLEIGSPYHFRVAAKNKVGIGGYGETSAVYSTLGKKLTEWTFNVHFARYVFGIYNIV